MSSLGFVVIFLALAAKGGLATILSLTLLRDATEQGAVCLDGSAPGYYYKKGSSEPSKWIIHMEGGGYCANELDCVNRSHTDLGSSKNWRKTSFQEGFLSDNCLVNPHFCGWTKVFIPYCDGAFFAGNVVNPVRVGSDTIYFRGIRILDVVIGALLELGVKSADHVILTGCSAGGHATYLHADHVRNMIPRNVPLHAFADAGFFLDAPNINGQYVQREIIQYIYKMQNVSNGGVNKACLAAMSTDEQWKCLFVPYTYSYINTPIFTYNSPYDTWQLENTLQLNCLPPLCSDAQLKLLKDYGQEFLKAVSPAIQSSTNGVFLDSCLVHCQSLSTITWIEFRVSNQTIGETLYAWITGNTEKYNTKVIDCTFPCNPTCPVL